MTIKRLLGTCAIGCGIAVLAACSSSPSTAAGRSSSGGAAASAGASSSARSGGAGAPGSPQPGSQATTPATLPQLKTMVVQAADLPAGWAGMPSAPDPAAVADSTAMLACAGARDIGSDKVAQATSSDFNHGTVTIGSFTTSYRSGSGVDGDTAMAHNPKITACLGQLVKKQLATSFPAGTAIDSTSVKIVPGTAGGPANVIATGTASAQVTLHGHEIARYLTTAFIAGPLVLGEVYAFDLGAPVPASVTSPLIAAVAARVSKG